MTDWPHGNGEMAARIRAFDWATTPLGSIKAWSPSLRFALATILEHPLPMVLCWGPDLITLYNDAYRPLLGGKPEALGRPILEVWAEACDLAAPQLKQALAGEAIRLENAPFTLLRHGRPEQAFFNYTLSPVRDETGTVVGVLNTSFETTEHVLAERRRADSREALRKSEERQAFLLALGDAMRAQSDAHAIIEVAARLLGEQLNASRIMFAEFDEAKGIADIFFGWFADGAKPFPAVMRLDEYEGPILDNLRAGRTVRVEDTGDPALSQPDLAAIAQLGVAALLSVPLIVGGRLVVNLSVHQHTARRWADYEVALAQKVAERLWADLVRARAEAALRESEAQQAFLLALSDSLRPLGRPLEIAAIATARLSERLQVDRVYYGEIVGDLLKVEQDHTRGVPSLVGEHSLKPFGREFISAYKPGAVITVEDIDHDPKLTEGARTSLRSHQIAAFADAVLFEEDGDVNVLAVQSARAVPVQVGS